MRGTGPGGTVSSVGSGRSKTRHAPPSIKTILSVALVISMLVMLALSVLGSYAVLSNLMTENVHEIVRSEFDYLGASIDRALESQSATSPSLEGYIIGEDPDSFAYIVVDGTIVSGTNAQELRDAGVTTIEGYGIDLDAVYRIEQDGSPLWTTLGDGKNYAIYAYSHDGQDIILGISRDYLYANVPAVTIAVVVLFVVLFAVLYAALSIFLDRSIVRSFQKTGATLQKIADGDLDETVDIRLSSEFCALSDSINATVSSLKEAIARAEKAAWVERDLSIARTIQLSAMPRPIDPETQRTRCFSLFADIATAKEVGGDFYDYFFIDGRHLGFAIADVSGKGIPAALFMMMAKTAIRTSMKQSEDLAEAFDAVNVQLCENNDAEMFVTAFAGVVDLRTGAIRYVNAGHNPAILVHDGAPLVLTEKSGPLIGMIEGARYRELRLELDHDDLLFLYTDGLTEARDGQGRLFGLERLRSLVADNAGSPAADAAASIRAEVTRFGDERDREDDMTLLLLKVQVGGQGGQIAEAKETEDE